MSKVSDPSLGVGGTPGLGGIERVPDLVALTTVSPNGTAAHVASAIEVAPAIITQPQENNPAPADANPAATSVESPNMETTDVAAAGDIVEPTTE